MLECTRNTIAAVCLVVASPVASWWVIGDQTETGYSDLSYMVHPPRIAPAVATVAGVVAVTTAVIAAALLVRARYRRRISREWLATPVLLGAAGAAVALGWRTVTAGVIGANIGGGLVLLVGPPAVVGLVLAAVVCAGRESAAQH